MISCPECGSNRVRIHGLVQTVEWARKHSWWPWSPLVPRGTILAHEVSCADCVTTYVGHKDGRCVRTPMQQAFDLVKAAKEAAAQAAPDSGNANNKPPQRQPAPAPDPRAKRK